MAIEVSSQEWNSSRYDKNARFVSDLGEPVVDLLNPQPGERILDLACGDGALTEKILGRGAQVVGVDGSRDMVAAAQKRGIDARVLDAYQLDFTSEFDAVFSNAALHWMKRDPDAVIQGVRLYHSSFGGVRLPDRQEGAADVKLVDCHVTRIDSTRPAQ